MPMMMQMSSTQVIFGLAAARPGKKMQQENSPRSSIPGPMPRDREGESIPTNAMHYLFQGRLGSRAGPSDRLGLVAVEQQSLVACSPVDQGREEREKRWTHEALQSRSGCIQLLLHKSSLSLFHFFFHSFPTGGCVKQLMMIYSCSIKKKNERERGRRAWWRGTSLHRRLCLARRHAIHD